jgi:hypothetical protein
MNENAAMGKQCRKESKWKVGLRIIGGCWIFLLITGIKHANAWVYPEHRKISFVAIQNLGPLYQAALNRLWMEARQGYESRLTATVTDHSQVKETGLLDYAAWPAIAGDHSCSPSELLNTVLQSQWIRKVAVIGARLGEDLSKAKTKGQRLNALQYSDMQLIKADEAYVSRAGANNIHFLLPRSASGISAMDYFFQSTAPGAELNAIGAYTYFHTNAVEKIIRYKQAYVSQTEKQALLLAAFADEAFALHFLEDAYAAGHVAGTRGNASLQKGTHDYYNEAGLEVQTWDGKRRVIMGDANMRDEDAQWVAQTIQKSLEHLIRVAEATSVNDPSFSNALSTKQQPDINICSATVLPVLQYDTIYFQEIFQLTLVPGLANGKGELPRFRAELGSFLGVSASLNGSSISGGFGKTQTVSGFMGGLEANVRFGLGLDGVLNSSGDGLVFLQMGWKQEAASTNNFIYSNSPLTTNSLTSAIPARAAYNVRIRLPFSLFPGDLLLASPLLLLSPKTYNKIAIAAVNGGLIPWQSGFSTRMGRFQFILGREVGLSFYGLRNPKDFIIIPTAGNSSSVVEYRSTKIDFPILEYRPLRTFSQDQSSSLMLQLNAGVDIPYRAQTIVPAGDPVPELKRIWYIGMRVLFNWRHYF